MSTAGYAGSQDATCSTADGRTQALQSVTVPQRWTAGRTGGSLQQPDAMRLAVGDQQPAGRGHDETVWT